MTEEWRVLIELRYQKPIADFSARLLETGERTLDTKLVPKLEGLTLDEEFPPVFLPGVVELPEPEDPKDISARFAMDETPEHGTYLVRGTVASERRLKALEKAVAEEDAVVGVYVDARVESCRICPGDAPMGTDKGVERLLCVDRLHECGMDGLGVLVAIVDTGINMDYLRSRGKIPGFDQFRSWVPDPGLTPGALPVGHGTMCAYDVTIAAPQCTLLDIALLRTQRPGRNIMEGFLSDAVLAYRHLIDIIAGDRRPGDANALVVNNSWGMFHPSWDFPVGHPGNYSDNPNHPFNRIVGTLERAGADILFAAGNCGRDCPDGRCQGVTNRAIYGANSHPQVLCIAGVDTSKDRVGYSAIGPGRLERMKPDLCGYTHFKGSGVYAADGGTSAASPVVAGVVAALRSRIPYNPGAPDTSPAAIRTMLTKTAEDRGLVGYDFEYGWGIVNGCRLAEIYCEEEEPKPKKRKKIRCKIVPRKKIELECERLPDEYCKDEIELECECVYTDDDSNCDDGGGGENS